MKHLYQNKEAVKMFCPLARKPCKGNKCMLWRFVAINTTIKDITYTTEHGYCGLGRD